MRIGVIGAGSIGTRHIRNILAMGHDVWAYDPGRLHNNDDAWRWCADMGTLVDLHQQAMLICTPASTHAAVARELLTLGYTGPLFVEKPLALSSADCDVFRAWPSPVTMVGYMLRFHADAIRLRNAIPEPRRVACRVLWDGCKYANPLFESSHEIDLLRWFGCTAPLTSVDGNVLMFGDIHCSWVHIDAASSWYSRMWWVTDGSRSESVQFGSPDDLGSQMYVDELAHFLACVEKQIPTITPFADGIRVVEVCEQAVKLAGANL